MEQLLNLDALSLALASGIAALLIMGLKMLFSLLKKLAGKTPTKLDDDFIDRTEKEFKDKAKDL